MRREGHLFWTYLLLVSDDDQSTFSKKLPDTMKARVAFICFNCLSSCA